MNPREFFFMTIKSQFPWANCALPCQEDFSFETLNQAYSIAVKQDLGHLFCSATINLVEKERKQEFNKQKMLAIFRREQITFEEDRIFSLFDENKIDYVPLKGSVIKKFYPEEWMRTSSDTDVLIRPENGEKAVELLKEKLSYRYDGKSVKDYQLFSPSGVHLELHYSPESGNEIADRVLSKIWNYAENTNNESCRFELSNEFLMFHTVAHALYHFLGGGCGVKPFLDFWVMSNNAQYDEEKLNALITECGCKSFYSAFKKLVSVWFEGKAHSELTKNMEDYIFDGGVYGNRKNLGKAKVYTEGGRTKYLFKRIFKPRKELDFQYPNLEKRPWLLPYYQVKRWFNLFNKDRRSDVNAEISGGLKKDETEKLFKELGL